jgi:hypothetical protein
MAETKSEPVPTIAGIFSPEGPAAAIEGGGLEGLASSTPIAATDALVDGKNLIGGGSLPGQSAPTQECANGGSGGPGQGLGSQNNNAYGSGLNPKLTAAGQCAQQRWQAANPGMKVYAFSGKSARPKGASRHPSGNAVDYAIYGTDGVLLKNLRTGNIPANRAYESFAESFGSCYTEQNGAGAAARDLRWGGNFGGNTYHDSMHIDYTPGGATQRGDIFSGQRNPYMGSSSTAAGNGIYDGPKEGAAANAGGGGEALGSKSDNAYTDAGNAAGAGCGDSSGCRPSSAAAPAAAAAMNAGQGLGGAQQMMSNLSSLAQNPMAAVQGGVQQALAGVVGAGGGSIAAAGANLLGGGNPLANGAGSLLANGAKQFLSAGGMSNPLGSLTQGVAQAVQGIGGGILPSLTGVVPALLQGGDMKGLMTGVIQNTVGSVIGKGLPQLGGFTNIFQNVMGAAGGMYGIKNNLLSSAQQIFGNATTLGGLTPEKIPGFNIGSALSNPLNSLNVEGDSDSINFIDSSWKPAVNNVVDLTKPFNDVLKELTNKTTFNGFTSMFDSFNAMSTQGLGKLTDRLPALGVDLANLNLYGDLDDLLNIGTPHQLARQMIEKGMGISTGLLLKLNEAGLDIDSMYDEENNSNLVFQILQSIDDEQSLKLLYETFLLDPRLNIKTPADLLDPSIVFPFSYEYNKFENIRDLALTLAICGGTGRLKNFGQLGRVIASMETLKTFSVEDTATNIITPKELADMLDEMPVSGKFSTAGPTVADFIGTVAGYTHDKTLPRINELLQELYDDARTDDFYDLMDTLTNTLNGDYLVPGIFPAPDTIVVPGIGTFSTLDSAVTAVINEIEDELENIVNEANTDSAFKKIIDELESLHMVSSETLYHEQTMRQKYGLEFGNPQRKNNFVGDGTTKNFPLQGKVSYDHLVYLNGVNQLEGLDWDYNSTNNEIVFDTAPAISTTVSLVYNIDSIKPGATPAEVYDFAANLENIALMTGHGGPADFLKRIIQDDEYGMRINAVLVQSRNFERLSEYGIACPGFNRIFEDNDNVKNYNFVDTTGIWSPNPSRAGEIWNQNKNNSINNRSYLLGKYQNNREIIQADLDILMQNITRQLFFYFDGNLAMSELMLDIYQRNQNNQIYNASINDLIISYSEELPTDGYVIGFYKEIISEILDKENIVNDVFTTRLSTNTENYLKSINMNIKNLVTISQRILTANGAIHLGISEGDFQAIFGIQSLSKALLSNIANNY